MQYVLAMLLLFNSCLPSNAIPIQISGHSVLHAVYRLMTAICSEFISVGRHVTGANQSQPRLPHLNILFLDQMHSYTLLSQGDRKTADSIISLLPPLLSCSQRRDA